MEYSLFNELTKVTIIIYVIKAIIIDDSRFDRGKYYIDNIVVEI